MKKPQRKDRMVIAYINTKVRNEIRKYCKNNQITLATWADLANQSLKNENTMATS